MQIDIDFEVFKALTALRESESDSYNSVIRRLLNLPDAQATNALLQAMSGIPGAQSGKTLRESFEAAPRTMAGQPKNALLALMQEGAWLGGVHFPDGTQFRASYKGKTYFAEIKDGCWIGADGIVRSSPSHAASAISQTNVNGWRFWFAKRPQDDDWTRMDGFKQ